jgi:hypothetical protein
VYMANNLTRLDTTLPVALGKTGDEERGALAWTPHGHKLAAVLEGEPMKLAIWSPEHGIEVTLDLLKSGFIEPDEYHFNWDYYDMFWSPDGRHIRLWMYWGHGSHDIFFGYDGKRLTAASDNREGYGFIDWTDDGRVAVIDTGLGLLDLVRGKSTIIHSNGFAIADSVNNNGKLAFAVKKDNHTILHVSDINGKNITAIYDMPPDYSLAGAPFDPPGTWSPSGEYLTVEMGHIIDNHYETLTLFYRLKNGAAKTIYGTDFQWLDEHKIVFVDQSAKPAAVHVLDLASDTETQIKKWNYSDDLSHWLFDMSPDGQLLVGQTDPDVLTIFDGNTTKEISIDFVATPYLPRINDHYLNDVKYSLVWAPDSSALAFVDQGDLLTVISRTGEALYRKKLDETSLATFITWAECQ